MHAFSRHRGTLVHRAVAGTMLSALAVTGLVAAPQRAAAADCSGQSTVGGGNCTTALINAVGDEVRLFVNAAHIAKSDNARFTQDAAGKLSTLAPGYNIMVFKYDGTDAYDTKWFVNPYTANMNSVVVDTTVKLEHHDSEGGPLGYDDFRIWIFAGDSTFTNMGDGGYVNWAFVGNDSDRSVVRHRSCGWAACDHTDRIIHFPGRTVPGTSSGGPADPGVPATPGIPVIVPGVPKDPGTPLDPGVPATPGLPLNPGVPATPGVPAHPGMPSGGVSGTLHPRVKNGQGVASTGSNAGAAVIAGGGNGSDSAWLFTPIGGGRYKITSAATGMALTENTHSYLAETRPWSGAAEQKWEIAGQSGGRFQIRISADDCLTYDENSKALGVWTCNNAWPQQWSLQS
ncbi:RICIN domain-containing protein [Streptomyces viridifaciens]|nr:hypothetical protein CP971_08000 [Streptomyces viridifaciens]UKZ05302.1 RICIN domain-containing protein [Streptomyces viridifaciens]